jgi:adenylosuccinate synthase
VRNVLLLTGRKYTGKSGLADALGARFGYELLKSSEVIKGIATARGSGIDRLSLQKLGAELDQETQSRWLYDRVMELADRRHSNRPIVVDNVATEAQLGWFRKSGALQTVHAHLFATTEELTNRFERNNTEQLSYPELDLIKNDKDVEFFKADADIRVQTAHSDTRDTLIRVAARLGFYAAPDLRCVDVIVGGQYGSEGKGQVAAYLSPEYDVLVRVGGPNAGHTVLNESGVFVYHQLPSGAKDTNAKLLLGPGMTIYVPALLKEIKECGVTRDRLFIDPQAMVIEDDDKANEGGLRDTIASTASGSGAASARRIMGRNRAMTPHVRLARDVPELVEYVGVGPDHRGSTSEQLELAYQSNKKVLLEGTQGSGLSIYHGVYPYVTSRDTNVSGCLAEAGISPARVRKILMVVRYTPIRVGNPDGERGFTSGPLKHETTFHEVSKLAGIDPEETVNNEKTSTTKRKRRVGWFEWELFRRSCELNAPTDIVLTFADYIDSRNRNARRFGQLTQGTLEFIDELENVAQAPVSLINTRFPQGEKDVFDVRTVIDRRSWSSGKITQSEAER